LARLAVNREQILARAKLSTEQQERLIEALDRAFEAFVHVAEEATARVETQAAELEHALLVGPKTPSEKARLVRDRVKIAGRERASRATIAGREWGLIAQIEAVDPELARRLMAKKWWLRRAVLAASNPPGRGRRSRVTFHVAMRDLLAKIDLPSSESAFRRRSKSVL
jgi:hypothetical protein